MPRSLTPGLLTSVLCHAGLIALALLAGRRHLPVQPTESGTIELVMQQQEGRKPTPTAPATPDLAGPGRATDADRPAADPPTPAAPASAPPAPPVPTQPKQAPPEQQALPVPVTTPTPQEKAAVPAPAAAAPTMPTEAKAAPPPRAQPAPTFDFSGTDDFNAIAFGAHILPAEPDNSYRNDPPRYPRDAAMRGEHGTVLLLIHVSAKGLTLGSEVLQSSGFASLDNAAVAAVQLWHFRAAMRDGQPVPFDMPFRFVFEAN